MVLSDRLVARFAFRLGLGYDSRGCGMGFGSTVDGGGSGWCWEWRGLVEGRVGSGLGREGRVGGSGSRTGRGEIVKKLLDSWLRSYGQ